MFAPLLLPLSLPSYTFLTFELPRTFSSTEDVSLLKLDFLAGELSTLLAGYCNYLGMCDSPESMDVGFLSMEGKNFLICETCALT